MFEFCEIGLLSVVDFSGGIIMLDILVFLVIVNFFIGQMNGIFFNNGFNNINVGVMLVNGVDLGDVEDILEDENDYQLDNLDEQFENDEDEGEFEEEDEDDDNIFIMVISDFEEI